MSGKRHKTGNIFAMLSPEVRASLPNPFAPDRAKRVEEALLQVVDVPQGNKVLRAYRAHNHHFFHVETLRNR
jgi:hypothetical protein